MFLFRHPNHSQRSQKGSRAPSISETLARFSSRSSMSSQGGQDPQAATDSGKGDSHVYYPIQGISVKGVEKANITAKTPVPLRQNIDTWSSDPANEKQVKLFVAALDRFQKIDPRDRDSYFQIAGIHGQPNVPWDEPIEQETANGKGYCTHNNILFPIWHRAYLALYEVSHPILVLHPCFFNITNCAPATYFRVCKSNCRGF